MRIDARPIALNPDPTPDAARIDKVAREMEGVFAQMMIKQMRQTALGDSMFPGAAGQFRDLHDEQIAKALTAGRGLGLSEMIARQLTREAGGDAPAGKNAEALPLSLAKAERAPMLPLEAYVRPLAAKPMAREGAAAAEHRPLALATSNGERKPNWIAAADVPRMMSAVRDVPAPAKAVEPAGKPSRAGEGPGAARVDAFVAKVWPHAQKIGRELGVDPRAIVAQAALETGWGRSTISANGQAANNYFGIKATGGWRGERVATDTQEFVDGEFRMERAAFRAYDGVGQSFADYAALLKRAPRYAEALGAGDDIRGFASALQRAGYATDPAYARKIEAIATGPTLERALARLDVDDARNLPTPDAPAIRNTMFAGGAGALGLTGGF
jgi:flagellar protein FlgJ